MKAGNSKEAHGTLRGVEAAVTAGKRPEMDDITSELISSGVEGTVKALKALCQKIWEQKKWPKGWPKSIVIPLPKKGSIIQCQDCKTIRKHLEHQRNLYHNFIDFKKEFDRVCHHGLWKVLMTITAASYPEQSTKIILPGIPSASDRGVYSLLFCPIFP